MEQHRETTGDLINVVDIHSHILPEVDDGPKSWDVSVAMCRAAAADGITHMVATPHANDRYKYDREHLTGVLAKLQESGRRHAEVDASAATSIFRTKIFRTRWLTQALRHRRFTISFGGVQQLWRAATDFRFVLQAWDCGITAIITHPERNPILRESRKEFWNGPSRAA